MLDVILVNVKRSCYLPDVCAHPGVYSSSSVHSVLDVVLNGETYKH